LDVPKFPGASWIYTPIEIASAGMLTEGIALVLVRVKDTNTFAKKREEVNREAVVAITEAQQIQKKTATIIKNQQS
jgi:hypothetical protein